MAYGTTCRATLYNTHLVSKDGLQLVGNALPLRNRVEYAIDVRDHHAIISRPSPPILRVALLITSISIKKSNIENRHCSSSSSSSETVERTQSVFVLFAHGRTKLIYSRGRKAEVTM